MAEKATSTERLDYLDGLRGVAAMVVVVFHLLSAFAPWLVPEQQPGAAAIAYSPLAVLWNGTFAVAVFFTLSGFVVTEATLRKADPIWVDAPIRYLRLAAPAAASTLFAWGLLSMLPTEARSFAEVVPGRWLQWTYQDPIPGVTAALYDGAFGVFRTGGSSFNNVLWTMRPELLGSLICFVTCLFASARLRALAALVFGAAALVAHRYEYGAFVAGILLREIWAAGRLPAALPLPALLLGLLIGSQSGDAAARLGLSGLPEALDPGGKGGLLYPGAAVLVVYGTMRWQGLRTLLSSRPAKFLGAISFPLYLIHVPLIYTVLFRLELAHRGGPVVTWALILAFLAGLLVLSAAAERYLERPFLRGLGALRQKLRSALPLPGGARLRRGSAGAE